MKKILVTSDWHLDHVTAGVQRFEELRHAVFAMVARAIDDNFDAFLFLGDLCDPDSGSSVFRAIEVAADAAMRLATKSIPSIWLAGNHDVIEDGTGDTTLSPLRALSVSNGHVTVVERPKVLRFGHRLDIVCLPFTATSHAYDVEKFVRSSSTSSTDVVVLGHLSIPGIIPGEETHEMPRGREICWPHEAVDAMPARRKFLANGHYHRQQVYRGINIPGSLARLTFGEKDHEPSFLIVEV